MCVSVCLCGVCVPLFAPYSVPEGSTKKVRMFFSSRAILAGPHNKELFEDSNFFQS